MIVLIDAAKQEVRVATENGMKTFGLGDADGIAYEISGKAVYYVTSAQEAQGEEILGLLSQLTGQEYVPVQKTGRMFLRSTARGKLVLRGQGEDLVFESPIDFKAVSSFHEDPKSLFPDLDSLIRKGRVEVVDESEIAKIRSDHNNSARKPFSTREQELDKMIVQERVEDRLDRISAGETSEDVIAMEISQRDLSSTRSMNSEVLENMRQAGVDVTAEE